MILTRLRQHRVLAAMHSSLRKSDPHLVATFAMFTRLTRDEAIPAVERVRPWPRRWADATARLVARRHGRFRSRGAGTMRRRRSAVLFIPVAAAAMLAVAFLLVQGQSSQAGCAPARVLGQASTQHEATQGRGYTMAPACPAGQFPPLAGGH